MNWTEEEKKMQQGFRRDGYVFLRQFLSAEEVAEVHESMARVVRDVVPTMPAKQVYYEDIDDPSTLKQLQQLHSHDDLFREMFEGRFKELAAVLLEGPVDGKNMQYFNKPPRIGKATPPHQDGYYFMINPSEAVTMWLALDVVDEENGCVHYVKGSNHTGFRPHGRTGTLGFSQGITDFGTAEDQKLDVSFPAQPGDLLVHHCDTIHYANGNTSQNRTRKALGLVYYAQSAQVDEAAHAAYQARLAKELAEEGKI